MMRFCAVALVMVGMGVGAVAQTPGVVAAPIAVPPVYPTGAGTALGAQITALLSDPAVARAHWGIAVTAMDGTPLWGLDEGKMFRPASNAKLFTTAAAMALLAPDVRVKTTVMMLADLQRPSPPAGEFDGTIAISSDGDAYLSDRVVPYPAPGSRPAVVNPLQFFEDTAKAIAATGVKTVKGSIGGGDGWMGDPLGETWSREDVGWGYGAPVSSLSVNDNQLRLTLTPGRDILAPGDADYHATAALYPKTGFYTVKVDVDTTSGQEADVWVDHPDGPRSLHIYGHIPPGAPYVTEISISDPALFAAVALKEALERQGIEVEAEVTGRHNPAPGNDLGADLPTQMAMHRSNPPESVGEAETRQMCAASGKSCSIVGEHVSPTMAEDVAWTMKVSQNLHAEMLLRRLAYGYGNDPTASDGTWVLRQWLLKAGLDGKDFVFYDGSGLSPKELVTPRATAQLLAYAATQPWFAQWKAALPVGGVDGSLASRFKEVPLKGHVYAKTGTLGESRALSGYVDAASGRTVVFSILVDNHAPGSSADRVAMDKIVAAIAAAY